MRHIRPLFLALTLLLPPHLAMASEGVYDIEMVIFEQPDDGDSETFPIDPVLPDPSAAEVSLTRGAPGIELLPLREGRLGPAVYTLDRKGARVLAHLRWRQDIPRETTPWYRVTGDRLDGMIRLKRGRYLHLETDLVFNQAGRIYRVQEHARARSAKLHYVDHPKLGLLFRADRWENPNAQPVVAPRPVAPAQLEKAPARQDNPPEQRAPAGDLPRATPDNS